MPEPDFTSLAERLLQAGVAPRHARDITAELEDHYEDLVDAARQDGHDAAAAAERARAELGECDTLVAAVRARPELQSWGCRHPRLAAVAYPLACVAVLPAVPFIAGIANASLLARWAACLLAGALITAAIFLVLQLSITLT